MNQIPYYVYALKSISHDRLYVGITNNTKQRLIQHNSGYTKSTKPYRPWKLVYCEKTPDRPSAREKEKYLKTGYGKEMLKSLLENYPEESLDCNTSFNVVDHQAVIVKNNSIRKI